VPEYALPDIPVFDVRMEPEDIDAVERSLRAGWLTMGPNTAALESVFAEHIGVAHAVAVSSCTAALHLAYLAAGVGPGDEVIVPSYTFAATASAVLYCGARPVFADIIGLDNPSIDPDEVARRTTSRTKAVAAVHFAGYAAPVDELASLCDDLGLALIEDTAHAPSATLNGKKLGSFGLASAFSFFSNKVLPVGEGGLLATNDEAVARSAILRRSHGMTRGSWDKFQGLADGYDVVDIGFNYRIDDARSALCLSRFARVESEIVRRRELTLRYRELLRDVDALTIPYPEAAVATSSAYTMPVFLRDPTLQAPLRKRLHERHRIQTTVLYPSIHHFTAYSRLYEPEELPKTELAARTALMLPLFTHMTDEQQDRVVAALIEELAA
jgi:dTDP-4-amino-4,6-dideoxygalactose transaminase